MNDIHPWVARFGDRIGFGLQLGSGFGGGNSGRRIIRAAQLADRIGIDAVFLGDHPAWAPEIWVHFAALAVQTERIHFGPMVAAAPYRNPLLTARILSDIDHLSGGRVINGLGIGWNADDYDLGTNEFDRMGIPYLTTRERQEALDETIALIRGLWGPEPFSFTGRHHSAVTANVPPPLQTPEPPLIIAGGGERTLLQVAKNAHVANFGPGPAGNVASAETTRERLEVLQRHCETIGRDYGTILRSTFSHWVIMAPTEREVAAKVARYFPDRLDDFWGAYLVSGTPAQVAEYYAPFIAAGIQFLDLQVLDPEDEETITAIVTDLAPLLAQG